MRHMQIIMYHKLVHNMSRCQHKTDHFLHIPSSPPHLYLYQAGVLPKPLTSFLGPSKLLLGRGNATFWARVLGVATQKKGISSKEWRAKKWSEVLKEAGLFLARGGGLFRMVGLKLACHRETKTNMSEHSVTPKMHLRQCQTSEENE